MLIKTSVYYLLYGYTSTGNGKEIVMEYAHAVH